VKSRKIAQINQHKLCQFFSILKTMGYYFHSAKTSLDCTFMVRHKIAMHSIRAGRRSRVPGTPCAQVTLHFRLDWRSP